MQSPEATDARSPWTWADLLSTYRFWGLLVAFVLAGSASELHFFFDFQRFHDSTMDTVEHIIGITRLIWVPLSLVLAWIAIRTRPKVVLLVVAALAAAAFLTTLIPDSPSMFGLVVESILVPLLSGVMVILVPVLIGGACGSIASILVAFGLAITFDTLAESGVVPLVGSTIDHYGGAAGGWIGFVLILISIVLLIPIQGDLFTVAPPERGRSFAPVHRDPIVTALLSCFVPFYIVYWLYRVHGEEAYVKSSRKLLSPRAAAWISVIPLIGELMIPFILSTLADHNNEASAASGGERIQRPWAAFLCGLLCLPVGVGLVQASLNKLAAAGGQILAEPAGPVSA
jgi:hypothetical protein